MIDPLMHPCHITNLDIAPSSDLYDSTINRILYTKAHQRIMEIV